MSGPTDITIDDLRVRIDTEDLGNGVMLGDLRAATPADVLAVAATLPGVEKRWWCVVHALADTNVNCEQRHRGRGCGLMLVIPLGDDE